MGTSVEEERNCLTGRHKRGYDGDGEPCKDYPYLQMRPPVILERGNCVFLSVPCLSYYTDGFIQVIETDGLLISLTNSCRISHHDCPGTM